ncbi:MAG: hypothetical protein WCB12_07560 [Bryobacteraceae bacterium]
MTNKQSQQQYAIGMVGLGVLGRNLVLNMAVHGFRTRRICAASSARQSRCACPRRVSLTALGYLDGYRSAWLPANLIQAQHDYFGAHSYERIDVKGIFHTDWTEG